MDKHLDLNGLTRFWRQIQIKVQQLVATLVTPLNVRLTALETPTQGATVNNATGVTTQVWVCGKVVIIYFSSSTSVQMTAGAETLLFSVESPLLPTMAGRFSCYNNAATTPSELCMNGRMTTTGNFYIYSYASGTRPYGMVTYIAQ